LAPYNAAVKPDAAGPHAEHGGAFFEAIGEDFSNLERRGLIVNADVLDAWYDPAPEVLEALRAHLPWLVKTSPPTHGAGLREAVAAARGIDAACVLPGAGTSSLIYLALPRLVPPGGRVVLLDPTYSEYPHLIGTLLGAHVVRHKLEPSEGWRPQLDRLVEDCADADLAVLVNPNSPTGALVGPECFEELLERTPAKLKVWVDETYIDFSGSPSLEARACEDERIVVAKSMSKYYALSGVRVGYLVSTAGQVAEWERANPPWSVGLLAQVAGVAALRAAEYYRRRAEETAAHREALRARLDALPGLATHPSAANFILVETSARPSSELERLLRLENVFVRNCDGMSERFPGRLLRIAVKSPQDNAHIVDALAQILH
jgi:histidinol-phosphate/aromatic aminotransferase/cobyric acid decarboxylase-like protein